jgi:hypothetical protein
MGVTMQNFLPQHLFVEVVGHWLRIPFSKPKVAGVEFMV